MSRLVGVGQNSGWLFAAGIGLIVLGLVAWLWPVGSTVGLTLALGVVFTVGGIVRLIHAIQLRQEIGTGWRIFDAVVSLSAGVLLLRFPAAGMIGIAIAMIFYFFTSAVSKAVLAFGTRPLPGSGWSFVSAIASFALGIYMIATFPISALWVPGVVLAIDFIVYGLSLIGFAVNARRMSEEVKKMVRRPPEERRAA